MAVGTNDCNLPFIGMQIGVSATHLERFVMYDESAIQYGKFLRLTISGLQMWDTAGADI
jgi:hypothetical protein